MNHAQLQLLFTRDERPYSAVLSLYLNVDQSQQANLNRGFETELRDLLGSLANASNKDTIGQARFAAAARRITDFVSAYQPRSRGLILFFDEVDSFFWHMETDFPVANQVRWDCAPLLVPLANALDQLEQYGVVLVDRARVRLFRVLLNNIEEVLDNHFDKAQVRHLKTAGSDHRGSSNTIQRRADEHIRTNLRLVVEAVDNLVQSKLMNRLILAGTRETTAELQRLLPKHLLRCVIGFVELPMDARPADVLAATKSIAAGYEEETENQTVNEVLTAAAKKQKAVVGLGHTLKAVNSDRIWQLIYSEGFSSPGFECTKCHALFSIKKRTCVYCAAAIRVVHDVVERAVQHSVRNGGRIEVVTGEAAATLKNAGSIGAFLKAGSLRA
jgi:ribosomal protein L7Ae-like RNA K-turn-binding protein